MVKPAGHKYPLPIELRGLIDAVKEAYHEVQVMEWPYICGQRPRCCVLFDSGRNDNHKAAIVVDEDEKVYTLYSTILMDPVQRRVPDLRELLSFVTDTLTRKDIPAMGRLSVRDGEVMFDRHSLTNVRDLVWLRDRIKPLLMTGTECALLPTAYGQIQLGLHLTGPGGRKVFVLPHGHEYIVCTSEAVLAQSVSNLPAVVPKILLGLYGSKALLDSELGLVQAAIAVRDQFQCSISYRRESSLEGYLKAVMFHQPDQLELRIDWRGSDGYALTRGGGLVLAPPTDDAMELVPRIVAVLADPDLPDKERSQAALSPSSAPVTQRIINALQMALAAINAHPRFHIAALDSDSYRVARVCENALAELRAGSRDDEQVLCVTTLADSSGPNGAKLTASVVQYSPHGIEVRVEGYGDYDSNPGYGAQVVVDYGHEGLKALVWSDINQEDPTHSISLENAREIVRIPATGNP